MFSSLTISISQENIRRPTLTRIFYSTRPFGRIQHPWYLLFKESKARSVINIATTKCYMHENALAHLLITLTYAIGSRSPVCWSVVQGDPESCELIHGDTRSQLRPLSVHRHRHPTRTGRLDILYGVFYTENADTDTPPSAFKG